MPALEIARLALLVRHETKIIAKLSLALAAIAALVAARLLHRRDPGNTAPVPSLARGAGLLGVANVVIAVVWT